MANSIVHFEIMGKDKAVLETFYHGAFDWEIHPVMDAYSLVFPSEGPKGGIGSGFSEHGNVTIYVEVSDIAASLAKIESLGGKMIREPLQVPNGPLIAMFADPEGHIIGLTQANSNPNHPGN